MTNNIVTRKSIWWALALIVSFSILTIAPKSYAGIALGSTRVVYPEGQKQVQLAVTNNDEKGSYLIQSWIEDERGEKVDSFIMTPPLFSMKGKKENSLRIIDATNDQLPKDKESLYWINVKAIPAMDKAKANENYLQFAIISRIKLYYRPSNLDIPPEQAPKQLSFSREKGMLKLYNPTPYYLTVTDLKMDNKNLDNVLVPPKGNASVKVPFVSNVGKITYKTINDYGALTEQMDGKIK